MISEIVESLRKVPNMCGGDCAVVERTDDGYVHLRGFTDIANFIAKCGSQLGSDWNVSDEEARSSTWLAMYHSGGWSLTLVESNKTPRAGVTHEPSKPLKPSTPISIQLRARILVAEEMGMSRDELSQRTGINPYILSKFINGEIGLPIGNVDGLCDVLGLELAKRKD